MSNRATLKVNGKVIGNFDESSDDVVNVERIRTLLEGVDFQHGAPEYAAHRQADSYAYAVALLSKEGDWRALVPIVTNGAFAVELYFKAILLKEGAKRHGHSLVALYNYLSDKTRTEAESTYLNLKSPQLSDSTFQQLIENLDGCFENWRYLHEKASTNVVSVLAVCTACSVAKELCMHHLSA